MRYIGSKERLLGNIESVLTEKGAMGEVFADLFAGTSSVGRHFKKKGFQIISNDLLYFSYLIQRKYIENNGTPKFERLKMSCAEIISTLNNLRGCAADWSVFESYSAFGHAERQYLLPSNALRIDDILYKIGMWHARNQTTELEDAVLRAILIEAIPYVSNISGTYGAYLKEYDSRALKRLALKMPEFITNDKKNYVFDTKKSKGH